VEITLPEGTPWYGWAIVLTCVAVVTLVVTFAPILVSMRRKANRTEETVNSVHEQVANTHDTNLRADLDKVAAAVTALGGPLSEVVSTLQDVKTKVEVTSTAVNYLTEDARQSRREFADLRADRRLDSEKIDRVAEQLANHLDK
jgi:methyl-accepting chemotaxis protein